MPRGICRRGVGDRVGSGTIASQGLFFPCTSSGNVGSFASLVKNNSWSLRRLGEGAGWLDGEVPMKQTPSRRYFRVTRDSDIITLCDEMGRFGGARVKSEAGMI